MTEQLRSKRIKTIECTSIGMGNSVVEDDYETYLMHFDTMGFPTFRQEKKFVDETLNEGIDQLLLQRRVFREDFLSEIEERKTYKYTFYDE